MNPPHTVSAAAILDAAPAQPFLKWAGGKRALLPEIRRHIPSIQSPGRRYFEPFLGGGAVFFDLFGQTHGVATAVLGDALMPLAYAYRAVRDTPDSLAARLREFEAQHSPEHYLAIRALPILDLSASCVEVAARFVYLNRTGFNGLWRVNRQGRYNVPMGRYKNPRICDPTGLARAHRALRPHAIVAADFEDLVEGKAAQFGGNGETVPIPPAEPGDFVYFDPPYWPVGKYAHFRAFTAAGFSEKDQTRLRDLALRLKARGVGVLLSNADVPAVRELYKDFSMRAVQAPRAINSVASKRGPVGELLIW